MAKKSKPKATAEKLSRFAMVETLRALCDGSELSRYEIGRQSGVAESQLSRGYHGQRIPSVDVLKAVADVVGAKVTIRVDW